MPTWTFKGLTSCVAALFLMGCDTPNGMAFSSPAPSGSTGTKPVTSAGFADGAVLLTAPNGYCIDARSLKHRATSEFALLARCDTLGVSGYYNGFELALITVTVAPQKDATPPDANGLRKATDQATVLQTATNGRLSMVQLKTEQSDRDGLSPQHWRGAFAINGYLVGLALYAPETSHANGADGARILSDLAARTQTASHKPAQAQEKPQIDPPAKDTDQIKTLVSTIAGLFD